MDTEPEISLVELCVVVEVVGPPQKKATYECKDTFKHDVLTKQFEKVFTFEKYNLSNTFYGQWIVPKGLQKHLSEKGGGTEVQ